jgi:hypothetical protein
MANCETPAPIYPASAAHMMAHKAESTVKHLGKKLELIGHATVITYDNPGEAR